MKKVKDYELVVGNGSSSEGLTPAGAERIVVQTTTNAIRVIKDRNCLPVYFWFDILREDDSVTELFIWLAEETNYVYNQKPPDYQVCIGACESERITGFMRSWGRVHRMCFGKPNDELD